MRKIALLTILALAVALVAVGCGSGSGSTGVAGQGSQLTVNFGDAVNDQIIAFELTITSITLTGNGNPSVLAKPAEVEFVHNAGTVEPISLVNVPAGAYTGATITVSNPEVVIVDPATKQPVKLTATLAHTSVSPAFNLTIGPNASVLNFDLNLATSVTISGSSATVDPQFTATTSAVPAAKNDDNGEDEDNGEMEVRGTITDATSPKFTIQPAGNGSPITFTTDANTRFKDGITAFSQLVKGMVVSVESVTQANGDNLAREVESETETANGEEVEGVITGVACATATGCPGASNPATKITITTQKTATTGTAPSTPATGSSVDVPISSGTRFAVESHHLSGTFPAFDATHIGKAQRVEVDSENEAADSAASVGADKVKLQEQALTGTVSSPTASGFTLTVASTSAFASLAGTTTVTIQTSSATELKNVTVSANATVRVRGLLFINGTTYTMVAARITQP